MDYGLKLSMDFGRYTLENGQLPNRNPTTGIRYGIANARDLEDGALEDFEPEYDHSCGYCGAVLPDDFESGGCADCGENLDHEDTYSEMPVAWHFQGGGVVATMDEAGDVWIFESPVTTTGRHCSPCAPGAVNVSRKAVDGGPVAYTLPSQWWTS